MWLRLLAKSGRWVIMLPDFRARKIRIAYRPPPVGDSSASRWLVAEGEGLPVFVVAVGGDGGNKVSTR